jgi:hypothetical protein
MARVREDFTTQVESALLAEIRMLAKHEGRQLESVVEDALRTYVKKTQQDEAATSRHGRL